MRKKQGKPPGQSNLVRIIGGKWRGRKLKFVNAPGLRPTPDRVRETLFNWLQAHIGEAKCLDLFAGSGAIGFEALSRGASNVIFVEKNRRAFAQLNENIALLNAENASLLHADAFRFLKQQGKAGSKSDAESEVFDIIFLDPPFRKGHARELLALIQKQQLLAQEGMIYLEHERDEDVNVQDFGLKDYKQTDAGQVISRLLTVA
jgi:16S rRNA (guanine966-N2)-methyltransferase